MYCVDRIQGILLSGIMPWISDPQPAATCVNCVYCTNFTVIKAFMYTILCHFSHMRPAALPTVTGVALCPKNIGGPCTGLYPH